MSILTIMCLVDAYLPRLLSELLCLSLPTARHPSHRSSDNPRSTWRQRQPHWPLNLVGLTIKYVAKHGDVATKHKARIYPMDNDVLMAPNRLSLPQKWRYSKHRIKHSQSEWGKSWWLSRDRPWGPKAPIRCRMTGFYQSSCSLSKMWQPKW